MKRLIAEDDLVVVHSHLTRDPADRGTAVMDIFRLANGKIVEHCKLRLPRCAQGDTRSYRPADPLTAYTPSHRLMSLVKARPMSMMISTRPTVVSLSRSFIGNGRRITASASRKTN